MQKKSLIFTILSLVGAFIAAYTSSFSAHTQAILGIVSFAIASVLTTFFPSGSFVGGGWKIGYYIVIVGGILTQIANLVIEAGIADPSIINYIVLGIAVIVNQFGREYPKELQ